MTENQSYEWKRLIKTLRKTCPIRARVTVLRRSQIYYKGELVDGLSSENLNGNYTIRVNVNQPWQSQLDTLTHEFAHVYNFEIHDWHDEEWGKCFAKAYSAYEKWAETE